MAMIKGLALIGAVKALRSSPGASREALKPELHHYLEEKIFPSRWYPESDAVELFEALVEVMPQRESPWRWIGMEGARHDFRGTYSAFVQRRQPAQVFRTVPKIWRLYHDTGSVRTEQVDDKTVTIEIQSSLMRHEGFVELQTAHLEALAELAGASGASCQIRRRRLDPPTATWRLSWRALAS
ncbi:MAG: DUF2378 family protein [Thermoanaerobaculia bacterium]|nr:DUF2378 family protein [Thermoanaerobaculia bacterium]